MSEAAGVQVHIPVLHRDLVLKLVHLQPLEMSFTFQASVTPLRMVPRSSLALRRFSLLISWCDCPVLRHHVNDQWKYAAI